MQQNQHLNESDMDTSSDEEKDFRSAAFRKSEISRNYVQTDVW